jgi:hypothetical protein
MWHWVIAFGTSFAANEYEDRVGTSSDPLLFSDPPGLDITVRNRVKEDNPGKTWLRQHAGRRALLLGAGAIVLANLKGEHHLRVMADDATGFVEVFFFEKGATELVKNVAGRQRPELEFIEEQTDLTPEERADEEASRHNHQSFWSGSTAHQFSLMSYVDRIVAGRVTSRVARAASFLGFYGYAAYIGYTRLEGDDHYLTDVVAGAAAGIVIGRSFYNVHHPEHRTPVPHAPPAGARRGGARPIRIASLTIGRDRAAVMFGFDP